MLTPRLLRLASLYQLAATAVLAAAVAPMWPGRALGVLGGGMLMGFNFWLLRFLVEKTMAASGARAVYVLGLMFKFVAMFGLLALLLVGLRLDGIGVMIGLCSLFFGVGFGVLHQMRAAAKATEA